VEKSFSILAEGIQSLSPNNSLGISGGFALNCPTNSKLLDCSKFSEVIIDPHCEDGGCSVGAAFLSFYKHQGKFPKINGSRTKVSEYAYKGLRTNPKDEEIIRGSLSENAVRIANLIDANKVVGIFYLNSEVGPRALGHRSIIANVTFKENWNRVNLIKGRELWRPFAPATLKTTLRNYFDGGPDDSPFMLFNYKVREDFREKFPAITHFDGTSRVQTVTEGDEPLFSILKCLERINHDPVVMNTSFNGPGQPIIETETQALDFFLGTDLDAVLINNKLYEK
jgi:carbamoyltransferase